MPSPDILAVERAIAQAHRLLWTAGDTADRIGQREVAFDLEQIVEELRRIQEDLLKRAGALRTR